MIILTSQSQQKSEYIEQTIKHQINYNNIVADGGLITWLFLVDPTPKLWPF